MIQVTFPAPRFPIGTKFKTRHKNPRLCEVVEVLYTYNSAGTLYAIRYVSAHTMSGRVVLDRDVVETTIAMGLIALSPERNSE